MKKISPIFLACLFVTPAFAQVAKTNAVPETNMTSTTNTQKPILIFPVTAATVSAPFVLTNGYISQSEQTDVATDGKAIYNFTITNAGTYSIQGLVNAPDESANSFYVNIDAQPQDPMMIWDIDVTTGFEERVANWRGDGASGSGEFVPKHFKLTQGAHKLIIVGREAGTQLKTLSISPVAK